MKLKLKLKAVLAAVTFAFAGVALADINPGNSPTSSTINGVQQQGNGELFLSVWNTSFDNGDGTFGRSYTRDLGINLTSFLPAGTVAPTDNGPGVDFSFGVGPVISSGNVLSSGYSLVFGTDSTTAGSFLTSLLSTAGTVWSVIAVESIGNDRMLFTSNQTSPSFASAQLTSASGTAIPTHIAAINGLHSGSIANPTSNGSSSSTSGTAYSPTGLSASATITGLNTVAAVGSSMDFWFAEQITGNNAANITAYDGGEWLLAANGTLEWNAAAPIPEPGTYAMMLAGLAILGGIARRRTKA